MTQRASIRNGKRFRRLKLERLEKRYLLAVGFEFNYLEGEPVGFNHPIDGPTYRSALEAAANRLGGWLLHDATITMDVNAFAFDGTAIGKASSVGGVRPPAGGFVHHLIPQKILTGEDHNGNESDGHVDIYFFDEDDVFSYQTDPVNGIADDELDFQAVVIHELVHTLGFTSATNANGSDDSGDGIFTPGAWSMFDQFVSDVNGNRLIESDPNSLNAYQMNIPAWATHSTGGQGPNAGLFFDGPVAKSVYGGRVPLYSPETFRLESSVAHLDSEGYPDQDFIFAPITHLMSHTLVDRDVPQELTLLEKAILTDLGFSVLENIPPIINAPSGLTLEADSPSGYTGPIDPLEQFISTVTVTDQLDPNPAFSFTLPEEYSLGDHLILLHAVDLSGNEIQTTATLSIIDTTPPTLNVSPLTQTIEATSPTGYPFAQLTFETTIADTVDPSPTLTHDAPVNLPLGSHTITFAATDFSGNQTTQAINVVIQDSIPPSLTLPASFELSANHPDGADLRNLDSLPSLQLYATDVVDQNLSFLAAPDQVPLGTTPVTFTAKDDSGNETSLQVNLNVVGPFDFGDAALQYPVTLASNGARHGPSPLYLGSEIDFDLDGLFSDDATGDAADEDGVQFLTTHLTNPSAINTSSLAVESSDQGWVDAWIDFNHDGDWGDAGEQILQNASVQSGLNVLSFSVPAGAEIGTTFARVRLSSVGNLSPMGPADDGEVEDYTVSVHQSSPQSEANVDWVTPNASLDIVQGQILVQQGSVDSFALEPNQIGLLNIKGTENHQELTISLDPESLSVAPLLAIDGYSGNNTVHWKGALSTIDLTAGSSIVVSDVQTHRLSSPEPQSLVINTEAVSKLNTVTSGVKIYLSSGDTIIMTDREQWRLTAPELINEEWLIPSHNTSTPSVELLVHSDRLWHNYLVSSDINNDGQVTAGDALRIINELAARRYSSDLDQQVVEVDDVISWPNLLLDQNADNRVTSIDALRVINDLARNRLSNSSGEWIQDTLSVSARGRIVRHRGRPDSFNTESFTPEFFNSGSLFHSDVAISTAFHQRSVQLARTTTANRTTMAGQKSNSIGISPVHLPKPHASNASNPPTLSSSPIKAKDADLLLALNQDWLASSADDFRE